MSKTIYTVKDTNNMSYEEFGEIMENLIQKIENSGVVFDAVVPILRNGAVPATIIANKLKIIPMIPIQVKYDYENLQPQELLPFNPPKTMQNKETLNLLIVESNTYSGTSASLVYDLVAEKVPDAKLHYATVTRVYRNKAVDLKMYENYFWGIMTNEAFEAKEKQLKELNLRDKITIYPWESVEAELTDINAL